MSKKLKNIFFSSILVLSILLPMGISLAHSTYKHEHNFCTATDEHHIHHEQFNCSVFHYFSQTNYYKIEFHFELIIPQFHSIKRVYVKSFFKYLDPNSFLIRGPPPSLYF